MIRKPQKPKPIIKDDDLKIILAIMLFALGTFVGKIIYIAYIL